MALRRLQAEINDLERNPIENIDMKPAEGENVFHWKGVIIGPNNSPYKGGIFHIEIIFPTDYPFKPPQVNFTTAIYHPNIDHKGAICIGLLKSDQWKPATRITQVLRALVTLLEQPNPDDPLDVNIAQTYVTDYPGFLRLAKLSATNAKNTNPQ